MPADADGRGGLLGAAIERLVAASVRERTSQAVLLGLRRVDVDALRHIADRDDTTPTALSRALMLSSGGTTAVIDRLEDAGLLTRSPHVGGRRRIALRLTATGRATLDASRSPFLNEVATMTSGQRTESEAVERLITRLADAAERHADRLGEAAAASQPSAPASVAPTVLWG